MLMQTFDSIDSVRHLNNYPSNYCRRYFGLPFWANFAHVPIYPVMVCKFTFSLPLHVNIVCNQPHEPVTARTVS